MYMLFQQAIDETRLKGPMGPGMMLHPRGREALRSYLSGGRVVFQVDRASDIRRVVDFTRRNGIAPVIAGGAEAWRVAKELAQANVPVILNPFDNLPQSFDQLGARLDNAALLNAAGVRVVISTGQNHNARSIRQFAGTAVAHGLPWDVALAAITATPAEVFGMGASRGHIAVGQVADLVLWSGDPLEDTTLADQVWIEGRAVPMRSRQTDLRDRYAPAPTN
jgi:imidazolonepropionase-like amidohydrolase